MHFSLRENMMCGVKVSWLVGDSHSNEGGGGEGQFFIYSIYIYMRPWTTKPVLSRWGVFVAIARNTLYGSKLLILLLCQKSLGH